MTDAQAGDSTQKQLQRADVRRDVEALLFASGSPVTVEAIVNALSLEGDDGRREVEAVLAALAAEFCADGRPRFPAGPPGRRLGVSHRPALPCGRFPPFRDA